MDKYEYLWMKIRNNYMPGDISGASMTDTEEDTDNLSRGKRIRFSYEELMKMKTADLLEKTTLNRKQAEYIMSTKRKLDIDKEYDGFLASGVNAVTLNDEAYPRRLRYIENPPYALFYLGELPKDDVKAVAIIGSRNCTEYGRTMAETLAKELGREKVNIISGMAYGIDGIAQSHALDAKAGSTDSLSENSVYAILGNGVDICYPRVNRALYNRLKNQGGVISEYPVGTGAISENFPFRNRIISGLSDVVIVIEARLKSGTFITVDYALSQGKEIMALPGRTTDPLSVGCNALIGQGAHIVQTGDDVIRLLSTINSGSYENKKHVSDFRTKDLKRLVPSPLEKILLEREENMVYSVLDFYSLSPEEISEAVNMDIFQVMSILISLEMKGIIKEMGKNLYVKCR